MNIMTVKKLTFCILCFANAANLATDEDFNNENSSNSGVEEDILINKKNWNTRKWGSIYFIFPHISRSNFDKKLDRYSIFGVLNQKISIYLNFLLILRFLLLRKVS